MARNASYTLTEGELPLMDAIWKLGAGSVRGVATVLQEDNPMAYNTAQTMLRALELKGYIRHETSGRTIVFFHLIERQRLAALP